ncbi:MAG TPA: YHS domain-containing protein [Planctomycetaceae bacterium]|nr:YHS domain-containing protein [Planctomycetaceae bacterium]
MKRLLTSAAVCLLAVTTFSVYAEDEKKDAAKAGPKCPVSGTPCKKEFAADYKGAEVYFCCDKCPKAFAENPEKFATKANLQLVQTKQAKQTKCPLTGRDMADDKTVAVNGVTVKLCCPNCLGKVTKAEGDAQLELVFSDKAFKQGFEVTAKKEK